MTSKITAPSVDRRGGVRVPLTLALVLTLALGGCRLFGEAPPRERRSNFVAIPDRAQRGEPVDLADGLSPGEREALLQGMVELTASRDDAPALRQKYQQDFAPWFDALSPKVVLDDLKSAGKIGRLGTYTLPNDGRFDGADARYAYEVRPGDIVVLIKAPFAFAFYRLPFEALAERPEDFLEEASGTSPYRHVLVMLSSIVMTRE